MKDQKNKQLQKRIGHRKMGIKPENLHQCHWQVLPVKYNRISEFTVENTQMENSWNIYSYLSAFFFKSFVTLICIFSSYTELFKKQSSSWVYLTLYNPITQIICICITPDDNI